MYCVTKYYLFNSLPPQKKKKGKKQKDKIVGNAHPDGLAAD
jgi:hypothetical protein